MSVLVHALLAVGLVAYLEHAPQPDVRATLDLSSVELSFAEEMREAAAVAPMSASVAAARRTPAPAADAGMPETKPVKPLPPDAGEVKFPEPREDARLGTEGAKSKDGRTAAPQENRTIEQSEQSNNSPAPVAPRQARLDAPPKPKRNIRPDYPKGARQRGEQGDVVLEIRVNARGAVDDVKVTVSSGFVELDEAAIRAAKAAKFSPARSGHEPVASTARLKLQFKLK